MSVPCTSTVPRRGHAEPANQIQQRGLSCAVGADQADQFTRGHREGHAVDGDIATENEPDVGCGQRRHPIPGQGALTARPCRRGAGTRRRRNLGVRKPVSSSIEQLVSKGVDDLQETTGSTSTAPTDRYWT